MRRRLTVALVALVTGALVLAGAGALLIARSNARNQAANQLRQQGEVFAQAASAVGAPRVLRVIGRVLHLEDAEILVIGPGGALRGRLPSDLSISTVHVADLTAGRVVSGWEGNLAFATVPVTLQAPVFRRFQASGGTAAVLLTRQVGNLAPGWLYLILVGGITLLVAAGVAAWLSRRITRPLVEAGDATERIARGEFGTRVSGQQSGFPEIASLAASINSMAGKLEASRERESQLLLSVSHDLRTPLTSIRGYAEAIEEGVVSEDGAVSAARVIRSESERLERLVGDLLDLAKLEAQHLALAPSAVSAYDVVARTVESLRPAAGSIQLTLAGVTAVAWADPDRLVQVVGNLVQNALAYAATSVVVAVSAAPEVEISVTDDGPGIPDADLSRVFDRFYQVDRGDAARKGSGLGLAIVAELVRAMGGTVRSESPVGPAGSRQGTRMTVVLRGVAAPV